MKTAKTLATKRSFRQKASLAFAGVSAAAVLSVGGVAAANPMQQTKLLPNKGTCYSKWQSFGFKSPKACLKYWDTKVKAKAHMQAGNPSQAGSGYGGNVNNGVIVIVNGDRNAINVTINYISNFF